MRIFRALVFLEAVDVSMDRLVMNAMMYLEFFHCRGKQVGVHGIWDFASDGVWRHGGFGIRIVDFVPVRCEQAACVAVRDEREDVVGWDGEEWVVEGGGRHGFFYKFIYLTSIRYYVDAGGRMDGCVML